MNKDIRLATSFKGHRKRKKLKRLLGFGAEVYLIDLWLAVAMDCPEGVLVGWDEEDIADACDFENEPQTLVDALIECHWLEKNSDGEFALHDWRFHQGWACRAIERSNIAKKAAEARWAKRSKTSDRLDSNAESMHDASMEHSESNTPSPNPSPKPKPSPPLYKKMAGEIYELYLEKITPQKTSKKRAVKNIETWLKKDRKKIDLLQAIDNYRVECSPDPKYRKNPANFFGINEDFAFDYLPENFTPPKKQSLAQKAF